MSFSISKGSSPRTHWASPRQILCESGASMMAFATSDDESTSPTPTMPASVWTLTTRVSWLPSQRSLTSGRRRWIGSTRVIFIDKADDESLASLKPRINSLLPLSFVVFDDFIDANVPVNAVGANAGEGFFEFFSRSERPDFHLCAIRQGRALFKD